MKNFVFKKGLEHLVEAAILFSTVDNEVAAAINKLAGQITKRTNPVDKNKLENELKGLIDK